MWHELFEGPLNVRALLIAVIPTMAAAWICVRLAKRLAAAAVRTIVHDTVSTSSPLVRAPLRIFGAAAFIFALAILLVPALEMAGLKPRASTQLPTLSSWTTFGA